MLGVYERILILGIIPEKANFRDTIISKDLRTKITFTQDELIEMGIEQRDERIVWKNSIVKNFKLSELEHRLLLLSLRQMDKRQLLPTADVFIALCEKLGYTGQTEGE